MLDGRLKSVPFALVSIVTFPVSLFIYAVTVTLSTLTRGSKAKPSGLTILVSGGRTTKALVHARQFHRAGHRVILVEEKSHWFCASRYSNCVDKFYSLPDPLASQVAYTASLLRIVLKERVDIFVPCCGVATTICDGIAKAELQKHCTVLQFDESLGRKLDKKDAFMALCQENGLDIPKTIPVYSAREVMDYPYQDDHMKRTYIMKCTGVDDRTRNDLTQYPYEPKSKMQAHLNTLNITPANPYIMQEYLDGTEYCCQSIAYKGVLRTYSACKSSDVLMNYRHIPPLPAFDPASTPESIISQQMLDFATKFAAKMNLTGPIAFDFITTSDGRLLPIEANPRTHTANTNFYGSRGYEMAYTKLAHNSNQAYHWPILPNFDTRPTYWIGHELFNLIFFFLTTKPVGPREFARRIWSEREAEWDLHDPLPFLALYHWQWLIVFVW